MSDANTPKKPGKSSHLFWGSFSPLGGLSGAGLLIMASGRLAWAISVSVALLWVYTLSALEVFPGKKKPNWFPGQGRPLFLALLASFAGSLYLLLLWLASPLAALEVFLPVCLVPLFCVGSGVFTRIESLDLGESVIRAAMEALVQAGLLVALAFIREPLGYHALSIPGGSRGSIALFSFEGESFLPLHIIASSTGALLLLGYGVAVYRYFRSVNAPGEEEI